MEFDGASIYSMTITIEAGTYDFQVADPTWEAISYGASSTRLTGESLPLDSGDKISLTLLADSVVAFDFDTSDTNAATLTVTAQ